MSRNKYSNRSKTVSKTVTKTATSSAPTTENDFAALTRARIDVMIARMEVEFDDPEFRGRHEPLVRQFDAPLRDGRRPVVRGRRLAGGLIDLATSVAPLIAAATAGVHPAILIVAHFMVTVVPTTLFGFSFGKYVVGTRVVDPTTLRSPGVRQATLRWALTFGPIAAAFAAGLSADGAALLAAFVYAPVAIDLRGWHDRLSRSVVVGRSATR